MDNRRTTILLGLTLLVVAGIVGLTWANYRYSVENPGGSDFLPRWLGTRLFLTEGWSPYSQETTEAIQRLFYGRLARADEDQVLFVYPFYSFFLFAPFAIIKEYTLARAVWMTALQVCLLATAGMSISLSRWRISSPMLVLLLLFTALWYHSVRPLINANPSILIAFLLAAAFIAIRSEHDVLAGFLLALATIKPQVVVLLVLLTLLWAYSHRRWTLIWSFVGVLALMVAATTLFIPNWMWQNLIQVLAYPQYTLPGTPGAIFKEWLPGVGSQMGWVLTVFIGGLLVWEWRAALGKEFRWFYWAACLTLAATNLIGIRTAVENYIVMYPALVLVLGIWDERWGRAGRGMVILSMLALFAGLWWLFLSTVEMGEQPVQHPVMFFPLPLFLLVGLYWVRWWAIRPPRTLIHDLLKQVADK